MRTLKRLLIPQNLCACVSDWGTNQPRNKALVSGYGNVGLTNNFESLRCAFAVYFCVWVCLFRSCPNTNTTDTSTSCRKIFLYRLKSFFTFTNYILCHKVFNIVKLYKWKHKKEFLLVSSASWRTKYSARGFFNLAARIDIVDAQFSFFFIVQEFLQMFLKRSKRVISISNVASWTSIV